MPQYIVLMPISPNHGMLIMPAGEGEPPVQIDADVLFASASEFFSREERAAILIGQGAIAIAPVIAASAPAKAREHAAELPPPNTTKE